MDIVSLVFKENLHNGYWFFNEETIQFHEAQERLNELFVDRILVTPSSSSLILDIGCGTGHLTCRIAERKACKVTGIDINEEEVAKGREWIKLNKLHEKVTLQYGNMTDLPFENQTFAVVSAMESICCVDDREKAMQEIARVMTKDGRLVITDFVKEKPLTAEQQTALASEGLISTLSPEDSIALLKRTGFQVIEFSDLSSNTDRSYQTALTILKEHRNQLIEHFGEQEVMGFESEWEALTKIHEEGYFSYRLIVAKRIN